MPQADVGGRQGEPGAIRLRDARRQRILHLLQVRGTGEDALTRVEPVSEVHPVRGVGGEHHQPAHAGGRGRQRVPVGFLEAERGEQAPVDRGDVLSLLERASEVRQQRLAQLEEVGNVQPVEPIDVPVVALQQAL